ncbi:unnamed protein product, partial [Polarella glacialis]
MYERHFGSEMPDLKELVQNQVKPRLEHLARAGLPGLRPLVGLAHGDLNAANIMIDALDAVWLIDFATSVELPLFTDMCKFEMACLFEYAIIPITPQCLLEFTTTNQEIWKTLGVGEWLGVGEDTAHRLLRELASLDAERLQNFDQCSLEALIDEVTRQLSPQERVQARKALLARLARSQAKTDSAFMYCTAISNAILSGDSILESLNAKAPHIE